MRILRFPPAAVLPVLVGCLLWSTASVRAEDDASNLTLAVELFKHGEFLSCQELLVDLDRSKLNTEQQAVRDDYLNRVQTAITMTEKALRDLEDALTAIDEGEPQQAKRLLDGVVGNAYASPALRRSAKEHLAQLTPNPTLGNQEAPTHPKANTQQARALTGEADEMVRAARYDEARRLYEQAIEAVPGYPEAVDGLQRVLEHQQTLAGTRGESLISQIRRGHQINWQRTVTQYRDVEQAVREHVRNVRFNEANLQVIRARQIVEVGKQFADPLTKYESLHSELEALEALVRGQERAYHEQTVAETRRKIEELRKERLRETQQRRSEQIDALMNQAERHRKDGDLDAAIQVLRQAMVVDPKYKPARWRMDDFEDLRQYQLSRRIRADLNEQQRRSLEDVEESKIPWSQQLIYPDDWAERIARPTRQRHAQDLRSSRLLSSLNRRILIDFRNDPFDEVIERLADTTQLNIIVNWNDLKRVGVERNVLIDLSLPREITLKRALIEVLEQAGAGFVEIGFDVLEDAIKIASRETLDKETYTAAYDINDLLMEIPMFTDAPSTSLATPNRAMQALSPPDPRPWRPGEADDDEPENDPARASRVRQLIDLILNTISQHSWVDNGGTVGRISEYNGQLVVTQNSLTQGHIANLLGKLREQRAVQIAVEARFITVTSNYLEEMGIDIDIVLNSGNAGFDFAPGGGGALTDPVLGSALLIPRSFSRLGFSPSVPVLGNPNVNLSGIPQAFTDPSLVPQSTGGGGSRITPVPIINRVSSFTDASSLGSDVSGSFAGNSIGPAFNLFGSFLDNIQVDFLIRATQADSRSTVLTAPQLVLFNGQRAWVAVTIAQNFVSQLNPVVATGAVAQAPVTSTINAGAVLDVTATVSADKRYVWMTLRPGVTRLLALQTIPFSGGGAGGGFGGGTALAAFIQLPTLSSQRLQTTVSVPDGGTLLIGGQKLASETEVEAGVPILSKIPILKRLYSSRSMIKDEQTLLILVKPRILIQSEQEEKAFPSFGNR